MTPLAAVAFAVSLWMSGPMAQSGAAARDGEIRALYSDLLRQTRITLTIEPASANGQAAPDGMVITVGRTFDGTVPLSPVALFDVRVSAGVMPAARPQLTLTADGGEIDLAGGNAEALRTTDEGVSLAATIPAETLKRVAAASRITGNALGVPFELTASQREALRTFVARAMSDDPANAK